VIGISMSGTSVGPLPNLPSVPSQGVVFGSELAGLPQGALESRFAPPAREVAAAPEPAAVKIAAPVAVGPKPAVAPRPAAEPSTASGATAKPSTATRSTTKSTTARSDSSPVRMKGTSR